MPDTSIFGTSLLFSAAQGLWYKPFMDMDNLAVLIREVGRGKRAARDLTREQARAGLESLLEDDADPLQLGAFLLAERMKGESAEEIAGFVDATRQSVPLFGEIVAPKNAVDLPCYAGKRRAMAAHLIAALLVAGEGIPVVVHGMHPIPGRVSAWEFLHAAGVQRAEDLCRAKEILARERIVYLDLAEICPPLMRLIHLREKLGVRTFAHTVARLLNPLNCDGQLNGVFHAPYTRKMACANVLLEQPRSLVFMGAEGEPELDPARRKIMIMQQGGSIEEWRLPRFRTEAYPKNIHNKDVLLSDFQAMLQDGSETNKHATIQLMVKAFHWASGGSLPSDWQRRA